MNVRDILRKLDEISSAINGLLDVREAVTVDENMTEAAENAIDFLSEYAEMLKELKVEQ